MTGTEKETNRLYAMKRYKELELGQDKNLQEIVELASHIFKTPIALITLMDKDVQWIISQKGSQAEQMPRETSFCQYAIQQETLLVVPDAMADARFINAPVVSEDPHLRFYAGMPLRSPDGHNVGTLCVFDKRPREATSEQLKSLKSLTNQVEHLLELKLTLKALGDSIEELTRQNSLLRKIAQVQSHELRPPVSSIMGIMNVIKYDDYQANKECLKMMETVVEQLDSKVRNIVSLAANNNDGFNKVAFPVANVAV